MFCLVAPATESEQPAILQMPWFCRKFFNTIIRVGNEDENLQNFVPHYTFAWKMSTLWLWSTNEDLPTLRRFCISLKIKCCVGLVSKAKYAQTYIHLFKENKNRKTRIDNPKQTSPVQRDWPSIWPAVDANYKWGDPLVRPLGHLVILPPLGHLVSPDLLCDWPIHTQTQN